MAECSPSSRHACRRRHADWAGARQWRRVHLHARGRGRDLKCGAPLKPLPLPTVGQPDRGTASPHSCLGTPAFCSNNHVYNHAHTFTIFLASLSAAVCNGDEQTVCVRVCAGSPPAPAVQGSSMKRTRRCASGCRDLASAPYPVDDTLGSPVDPRSRGVQFRPAGEVQLLGVGMAPLSVAGILKELDDVVGDQLQVGKAGLSAGRRWPSLPPIRTQQLNQGQSVSHGTPQAL